ncbi:hypothetical protein A5881_001609 [Enterococcus termitis]
MTRKNKNIKARVKPSNSSMKVKVINNSSQKQVNKKRRKKKRQLPNKKKRLVRKKKKFQKKLKQFFQELGLTILITFFLLIIIKQLTFSLTKIEGYSMLNTLMDNDCVFVNKLSKVKRFDLVYYRDSKSNEMAVRRVIGLPREQFYYRQDQLFVEDKNVPERFLAEIMKTSRNNQKNSTFTKDFELQEVTGDQRVPEGKYFVLGDNRPYASDSRDLGYIDEKDIVGVVKMRVMPFHQIQSF